MVVMINVVFERAHGTWNKEGGGVLHWSWPAALVPHYKELCNIEMTLCAKAVLM